jgi:hypothetical protein
MRRLPAAIVLALLAATSAAAQPSSNWSPVRQLPSGAQVRAVADPGVTHLGSVRASDDESITLTVDGVDLSLPRILVREIEVAGKSRKKNIWWGLAVGAAASVVAVSLQCRGEDASCNEGAPAWFYPLAGGGLAVGAFLPPRTVWRVLYRRIP